MRITKLLAGAAIATAMTAGAALAQDDWLPAELTRIMHEVLVRVA